MKPDITNFDDVKLLVDTFYAKVFKDEIIGHIFTKVAAINPETHMPKMYAFWDSVLFYTGNYRGNTIAKHIELNQKFKLEENHFIRWQALFTETVDELFVGSKATLAKEKARTMEILMKIKLEASAKPGFVQ